MQEKTQTVSKKKLGYFTLAMMNVVVICTLRGLPMMAEEGFSLVFYYLFAALVFLIPVSLVSAELATGWPPYGPGGVYIWVKEAFGERWGFLAISLQWIQNVIWFPTVLSFIAGTIAYLFAPALANNKIYMVLMILAAYWGGTILSLRGMETSGLVSTIGAIGGVIFPGLLIIMLGIVWFLIGGSSEITFSVKEFFPNLTNIDNLVFLAGAFLVFSGMEVSAVHANSVENPKRDFPRAIFTAAGIAFFVLVLGSLAIAVIVPQKEISLVSGIMEAFEKIFKRFNLSWCVPVMAVFITAGSMGELCAWIIGPSKGLYSTVKSGHLPLFLQKLNRADVPSNILYIQAIIVTILSLVFLMMPTVSSSYWILSALCILLYLLMYLLLFSAAIRLRYSKPDVPRAYKIPGGNIGMWCVAGLGFIGALLTLVIGLFPPSQIATGNIFFYETFLIVGTIVMCALPLLVFQLRKPGWKP